MAYKSSNNREKTTNTKKSNGTTTSKPTSKPTNGKKKPTNSKKNDTISKNANKTFIGGQVLDLSGDNEKAKILAGTQNFMKSQPTNNYGNSTVAENASYFLGLIGVSVDLSRGATYSLLDEQSTKMSCEQQGASNPNMLDSLTAKNQKKDYPTGEDKFPSPDDPFYEAPATEPITAVLNTENLIDTSISMLNGAITFAADLADLGVVIVEPIQPLVEDTPFSLDFSLFG